MVEKVLVVVSKNPVVDMFTGESMILGTTFAMEKNQADFMIADGSVLKAPKGAVVGPPKQPSVADEQVTVVETKVVADPNMSAKPSPFAK